MTSPTCFRCGQSCDQLDEYQPGGLWNIGTLTPALYVQKYESTYNAATNHFACSACFLAIGLGSAALEKWIAP